MIFGAKYMVECKEWILQDYQHVDCKRINAITKPFYNQLRTALSEQDGSYKADDMMIAMLVHRFGFEMSKDGQNDWFKDAFPDFCSLIGPNSGFAPANEVPANPSVV